MSIYAGRKEKEKEQTLVLSVPFKFSNEMCYALEMIDT